MPRSHDHKKLVPTPNCSQQGLWVILRNWVMISDHDSDVPYNSIMSKRGQTSLQLTCTNSNSNQKQAKWITNSTGKRVFDFGLNCPFKKQHPTQNTCYCSNVLSHWNSCDLWINVRYMHLFSACDRCMYPHVRALGAQKRSVSSSHFDPPSLSLASFWSRTHSSH